MRNEKLYQSFFNLALTYLDKDLLRCMASLASMLRAATPALLGYDIGYLHRATVCQSTAAPLAQLDSAAGQHLVQKAGQFMPATVTASMASTSGNDEEATFT
jgi:hypothetical protein